MNLRNIPAICLDSICSHLRYIDILSLLNANPRLYPNISQQLKNPRCRIEHYLSKFYTTIGTVSVKSSVQRMFKMFEKQPYKILYGDFLNNLLLDDTKKTSYIDVFHFTIVDNSIQSAPLQSQGGRVYHENKEELLETFHYPLNSLSLRHKTVSQPVSHPISSLWDISNMYYDGNIIHILHENKK